MCGIGLAAMRGRPEPAMARAQINAPSAAWIAKVMMSRFGPLSAAEVRYLVANEWRTAPTMCCGGAPSWGGC